jgi:hypothetical protein
MFGKKNFHKRFWSRFLSDPRGLTSYFHKLLYGEMPDIRMAENTGTHYCGHRIHSHEHSRYIHSGRHAMHGEYSTHHAMHSMRGTPDLLPHKADEKGEEKTARCPLCGNACSADSLRCDRGQEFFGS